MNRRITITAAIILLAVAGLVVDHYYPDWPKSQADYFRRLKG